MYSKFHHKARIALPTNLTPLESIFCNSHYHTLCDNLDRTYNACVRIVAPGNIIRAKYRNMKREKRLSRATIKRNQHQRHQKQNSKSATKSNNNQQTNRRFKYFRKNKMVTTNLKDENNNSDMETDIQNDTVMDQHNQDETNNSMGQVTSVELLFGGEPFVYQSHATSNTPHEVLSDDHSDEDDVQENDDDNDDHDQDIVEGILKAVGQNDKAKLASIPKSVKRSPKADDDNENDDDEDSEDEDEDEDDDEDDDATSGDDYSDDEEEDSIILGDTDTSSSSSEDGDDEEYDTTDGFVVPDDNNEEEDVDDSDNGDNCLTSGKRRRLDDDKCALFIGIDEIAPCTQRGNDGVSSRTRRKIIDAQKPCSGPKRKRQQQCK